MPINEEMHSSSEDGWNAFEHHHDMSFLYDSCALSAFALTLPKPFIWYNHCYLSSSAGMKDKYVFFFRHAFAAIVLRALQLHTIRGSVPESENVLILQSVGSIVKIPDQPGIG
ncbi:hypothetical protein T03_1066 [Trichinella britovi]|uniref:Uncharacterized protein n=1 Tax=Trichinella britovi TaxID=45882 RepID=A0A0V1CIS8_TRIBR|nr:hypothetical protein T03_1066 [Trichinella britovi]